MSVKEIKAMGERLASHLASKHGVKLKHAAILEAMAVQFGFKDWNTFRTTLEDGNVSAARPSADKPAFRSEQGSYLVGYSGDKQSERCELSYDEIRRNLLICGMPGSGLSTLHQTLWRQHIQKGGGVIFLDMGHDLYMRENLSAAFRDAERSHELHFHDFGRENNLRRFNPLIGTPQEIARTITTGQLSESRDMDVWKDFTQDVLKTLVAGLQEASRPVTFRALLQLVDEADARTELIAMQPVGSNALAGLRDLQSRFQSRDRTTGSVMVLTRTALQPFTHDVFGRIFDSAGPALNIRDMVQKRQGLYINVSELGRGLQFQALTRLVVRQILLAIQSVERDSAAKDRPPFLVFLDSPGFYANGDLDTLFACASSADVGIVATHHSLSLDNPWTHTLLAQTWCKLFLRQATRDSAELASGFIGNDYKTARDGFSEAVPRAPAHLFTHFLAGEGWCLKGPHSAKIQVAIQENAA
jgi:hypothetical protein